MNLQPPETLVRFWALRDSGAFPHLESDFVAWMAGHCHRDATMPASEVFEEFLKRLEAKLAATPSA